MQLYWILILLLFWFAWRDTFFIILLFIFKRFPWFVWTLQNISLLGIKFRLAIRWFQNFENFVRILITLLLLLYVIFFRTSNLCTYSLKRAFWNFFLRCLYFYSYNAHMYNDTIHNVRSRHVELGYARRFLSRFPSYMTVKHDVFVRRTSLSFILNKIIRFPYI